jgi:hypothetical protein
MLCSDTTNMKFQDGRLHVEVPMGRVAYAGRAVPHGELHYDADNGAWYQVILKPARPPARRALIRRLSIAAAAVAGFVVAGLIASSVYLAKRQPAAPASAAASAPLPAPLPQPQSLPVAPFLAASSPAAVDVIAEPYRPSGPLPQLLGDQSLAVLPPPVSPSPQATLRAAHSNPTAATPLVKAADEKKESFVVLNKAPEKPAQLSQPAPIAASAKPAVEAPKPVEAPAVAKTSERGTAERKAPRLVTIVDASTIVIPDPKTGVPKPAKVGTVLPDGSTLTKVDPKAGTAETDKGILRLE